LLTPLAALRIDARIVARSSSSGLKSVIQSTSCSSSGPDDDRGADDLDQAVEAEAGEGD